MTIDESTQALERKGAGDRYLFFTVLVAGMSTLAVEFTTSRMLQTVYGTSNIVWANVIGLVLLFLTVGYFLGGRLADSKPTEGRFYALVSLAGFCVVFFLLLTSYILKGAAGALAAVNVGAVAGSLLAVVLALLVPVTLLGCLSPFAIRLAVKDVQEAGRVSGRVYAISTWGSLLGTYLPVLVVIPEAGTRATAVLFGSLLLLVGTIGLWRSGNGRRPAIFVLPALLVPAVLIGARGGIKAQPGQIYEEESAYNYIQVVRDEDCNFLLLNEGQAYHSYFCSGDRVPRVSVWSIMLVAPFFNEAPGPVEHVAIIGLAAGTIAKQYARVFDPVAIDGIEIDPAIVEAGRAYFELREANLNVIIGAGRYELNRLQGPYDVVTLDAYKVPYIPWHLTTRQFFAEVRARLTESGVAAVNVGRAPGDRRLVDAMATTMLLVFPSVHAIDVPGSLNTILVATVRETTAANLKRNQARLGSNGDELLLAAVDTAVDNLVATETSSTVFTDERAPVETIIDSLVLRYLLREGPSGLPGLGT